MSELTFDELVEATMQLEPELRQALLHLLQVAAPTLTSSVTDADAFTQTDVLSEAGAYSVFTPLMDSHPHATEATTAELMAAVQCLSCEWEEEAV